MPQSEINWEELSNTVNKEAGQWLKYAVICQLLVLIGNAAATLNFLPELGGLLTAGLGIGYGFLKWQSDRIRRIADSVTRKYEFADGMGWTVTPREAADLLTSLSSKARAKVTISPAGKFFSSKRPISPERLLENLEESSWWSRQLSGTAARVFWAIFAIGVVISVLTLLVTLNSAVSRTLGADIGKVVTSGIVFLFSAGYFRAAVDYGRFSFEAGKIDDRAGQLLAQPTISDVEALKLLHDYQVHRAGAPPIPNWIWLLRQKDLNEIWDQQRRQK